MTDTDRAAARSPSRCRARAVVAAAQRLPVRCVPAARRRALDLDADRRGRRAPTCSRSTTSCSTGSRLRRRHAVHDRDRAARLERPRRGDDRARARAAAGDERRPHRLAAGQPGRPGRLGLRLHQRQPRLRDRRARCRRSYDVVGLRPPRRRALDRGDLLRRPAQMDAYLFDIAPGERGTDEWLADIERRQRRTSREACARAHRRPARFVDTESAARDLDLLRAVLGDEKLNYLGYSTARSSARPTPTSTPRRPAGSCSTAPSTRRPANFEVTATQAQGFESALRAYLDDCLGATDCPFGGTVDEAMTDDPRPARLASTRARSAARTAASSAAARMFTAIIYPLYTQSSWPYLSQLFTDRDAGRRRATPSARRLLQRPQRRRHLRATTRPRRSSRSTASTTTATATSRRCAQRRRSSTRLAPVLGPQMPYGGTGCANWPFPSTRERGADRGGGLAPTSSWSARRTTRRRRTSGRRRSPTSSRTGTSSPTTARATRPTTSRTRA